MTDDRNLREEVELDLGTALPPAPGPDALNRMRQKAFSATQQAAGTAPKFVVPRTTAFVAAIALTVAILALSPWSQDGAFARDQAADALVFTRDGRATHVITRFTETSWNEEFGHDARLDLDQRTEEWYDPAGTRSYSRTVNVKDGSLDGASARVGDQEIRFQNNVRYMTGDEPQLMAGSTNLPFGSSIGFMTDAVREEIADGHAKVTGTKSVGGEECWVVTIDEKKLAKAHAGETSDPRSSSLVTVTLRQSDYLITSWSREAVAFNGNGKTTTSQRLYFERWEHVDRASINDSMFSLESIREMAPVGTPVTKTVDGAAVE